MSDLPPVDDDADPRLGPLLAWRQELVDSGAVAARSFKEAHLRLVLRSGRTDVEQIRAMLPGSVSDHAEAMARLLAELGPTPPTDPETSPGRHRSPDTSTRVPVTRPGPPAGDPPQEPHGLREPDDPPEPEVSAPAPEPDETALQPTDFATFQFGDQQPPGHGITIVHRDGLSSPGVVELSWPAHETDGVALYRVVSAENLAPYGPDGEGVVAVTTRCATVDTRPLTAPFRHYQVWLNTGDTQDEALAAQPVLYAAAVLVNPVHDALIGADSGRVVGRWTVVAGISAVHVYRVPVEHADGDPQADTPYRILADTGNLAGFVDAEAVAGQRYVYRARCAVRVAGAWHLSEAAEVEVTVSSALSPVTDMVLDPGDDGSLTLSWTPPRSGEVAVYLTQDGPGTESGELAEDALDRAGLTAERRVSRPVADQTGPDGRPRSVMSGVAWPPDWSRAYFTPVTTRDGRAVLGRIVSSVRTGSIGDIELADYCNKQVLTFDWPEGAASVVVYLAPKGHDPRTGLTGKSFEISLEEYEKYGGMHLTGQLPVEGCSLHLAPVAFSGGRRVIGALAGVEYPGLLRLQYAVRIGRDPNGFPTTATVAVRSERDVPGAPTFVLINNPQRIPLSVHDGQPVEVAPLNAQGELADQPSTQLRWTALTASGSGELWAANVAGLQGWIRLFVNITSPSQLRVVALLDPPVESLRLTVTTL
ncbi:hypothetical protein ACWDTP_06430 [Mycobacterium sp. NPDC003449]